MAKYTTRAGTTGLMLDLFVQRSSSTTGAGLTGLAANTSGLTALYHRDKSATVSAVSFVNMTIGSYTDSGFTKISASRMPGLYQIGDNRAHA